MALMKCMERLLLENATRELHGTTLLENAALEMHGTSLSRECH